MRKAKPFIMLKIHSSEVVGDLMGKSQKTWKFNAKTQASTLGT